MDREILRTETIANLAPIITIDDLNEMNANLALEIRAILDKEEILMEEEKEETITNDEIRIAVDMESDMIEISEEDEIITRGVKTPEEISEVDEITIRETTEEAEAEDIAIDPPESTRRFPSLLNPRILRSSETWPSMLL